MNTTATPAKGRPAFLVDKQLIEAAQKVAKIFRREEMELKKALLWKSLGRNGSY